ncbi:MAG TPA: aminoglycoside phosphotransferase family protein, partial [Pyrinomonadaceae bacterium]|nr:aminoglycoside phosphotransferase family protein [Pyrinomonadaceae bacterium]
MILSCYPDWIINSISFLGEGDFCQAYLVNEEWVFRFAKHREARESLKREYCLLPKIAPQITLQIPQPQIVSFENNLSFSAYRILPDEGLSSEIYSQLNKTEQTNCTDQVAHFLNQLHSIDLNLAQNCGVKFCNYQSQYSNLLIEAKEHLFPVIEKADCQFVEQVISEYLDSNHFFTPTLLHGDLSPNHVLFDKKTTSVSGIIDFGDMMIGDPAWDLLWIYEDYGLDFLAKLLPNFHEKDKQNLLERVFEFSMLQLIEWTTTCKIENDAELEFALFELSKMQLEKEQRFCELMLIL